MKYKLCNKTGKRKTVDRKFFTHTLKLIVFAYLDSQCINFIVGFEVLTAVSTKMAVFSVVATCSLVEVYQRFRGPCSSP
jgi:hypothetical protein